MKPGSIEAVGTPEAEGDEQELLKNSEAVTDANLAASATQEVVVISDTEDGIGEPYTITPPHREIYAKDNQTGQNDNESVTSPPAQIAEQEEQKPQPATSAAGGGSKKPPETPPPTPASEDGGEKPKKPEPKESPKEQESSGGAETPPPNDTREGQAPEEGEKTPETRIHVSEPRTRLESIEREVGAAGVPLDQATVVGSGAIEATLGDKARPRNDTDLMVSEDALRHLREQGDWEESRFPDGRPRLTKDGLDVGLNWNDFSNQEIEQRAWTTESGLKVANLGDVYNWKQRRSNESSDAEIVQKDKDDLKSIRSALQGPESKPLDPRVMPREVEFARNCLPERLRDDPNAQVAIDIAANGLHLVRTAYGDKTTGRINYIEDGEREKTEYKAPTTFNEGGVHTPNGMQRITRHLDNVNATDRRAGRSETFSDQAYYDSIISYAYHDGVYGNGRVKDEEASAQLASRHATEVGYTAENAPTKIHDNIIGTTFDQKTRGQMGKDNPDPSVRATTGVDLQGLSEPEALIEAADLAKGDIQASRFSEARTLGKVLNEYGVVPKSLEEIQQFIDAHPNAKPSDASGPDDPTIKEAYTAHIAGNAGFVDPDSPRAHKYPDDWTMGNDEMRRDHAVENHKIAQQLRDGGTVAEADEATRKHADKMREKYSEKKR
jgi:hypothetical protein